MSIWNLAGWFALYLFDNLSYATVVYSVASRHFFDYSQPVCFALTRFLNDLIPNCDFFLWLEVIFKYNISYIYCFQIILDFQMLSIWLKKNEQMLILKWVYNPRYLRKFQFYWQCVNSYIITIFSHFLNKSVCFYSWFLDCNSTLKLRCLFYYIERDTFLKAKH